MVSSINIRDNRTTRRNNEEYTSKKKQLEKFMKDVISMSKDHFVLHEWEKEKLDELVRENIKEENIKEGIAKGKIEKSNEIARNMLKEKVDIEFISKVTGLTVEEMEKLKDL